MNKTILLCGLLWTSPAFADDDHEHENDTGIAIYPQPKTEPAAKRSGAASV